MICKEIVRNAAFSQAQLVVDAEAVLVFRKNAGIIIHDDIETVVNELCVLYTIAQSPLHSAAQCVVFISHFLLSRRSFRQPILVVPGVAPEVRPLALLHHIAVGIAVISCRLRRSDLVERLIGICRTQMARRSVADRVERIALVRRSVDHARQTVDIIVRETFCLRQFGDLRDLIRRVVAVLTIKQRFRRVYVL